MSRIGKKPIALNGASVTLGDTIVVKGPKGELTMELVEGITAKEEGGNLVFERVSDSKTHKANHGLMRALGANLVHGVTKGFERKLEINGVGYKAQVKGKQLVMNLGFSHLIEYDIPEGITISVEGNTKVTVQGAAKDQVGQTAAVLRGYRPPDSYRGKGVRYAGEHIRLKAGKSAK